MEKIKNKNKKIIKIHSTTTTFFNYLFIIRLIIINIL